MPMTPLDLAQLRADLRLIANRHGDLQALCHAHDEAPLEAIRSLRLQEYQKRGLSYLCQESGEFAELESAMDRQSLHVSLWRRHALVGSARITPPPFELSRVTGLDAMDRDHAQHLELSRLILSDQAGFHHPAHPLMATVCLQALDAEKAGLIALCRPVQARLFKRYGMRSVLPHPLVLPQRHQGQYAVMAASWRRIADAARRLAHPVHSPQRIAADHP